MRFLEKLRQKDPASPAAYHLEGLLEAQHGIRALLETLGGRTVVDDPERWAELIDAAYRRLPDVEQKETS